ncbi:unnamed protein product [Dovyalis caffra]|uniref:Uncharacterized protein n=1 Tax=Dovyalis caffra TaxID=77055 RepID=A0AAV1QND3_9ROSI|nr:unnamed protein product [Dovyalis caffra]
MKGFIIAPDSIVVLIKQFRNPRPEGPLHYTKGSPRAVRLQVGRGLNLETTTAATVHSLISPNSANDQNSIPYIDLVSHLALLSMTCTENKSQLSR